MRLNEYQQLAARTINRELSEDQVIMHALHEIASEVGEIHGLYQKIYQGHTLEATHLKKEIGDLLWGIAELCTGYGWTMDEVCRMNIDKLRERYPNGFEEDKSINRAEGDV